MEENIIAQYFEDVETIKEYDGYFCSRITQVKLINRYLWDIPGNGRVYKAGKVRAIGVSRLYLDRHLNLHHFAEIKPAVNQVEAVSVRRSRYGLLLLEIHARKIWSAMLSAAPLYM